MIHTETSLPGVYLIELETFEDKRGFFARAWCRKDFEDLGLDPAICQVNMAFNHQAGTLRGFHYQHEPHAEAKTVRCIRGAIFDVALDIRESSPNYLQWVGIELSADNRKCLYIPKGFAHAYLTLAADTELLYSTSEFYSPDAEDGVCYNDPALAIEWPAPIQLVSEKDESWPDLRASSRPGPGGTRAPNS